MEIIIRKNCCIVIFLISVFIASALPPAYAEEALPVIRPGGKDFEQAVKGMRQEFVDIAIEGMKNTAGIFYEVPIVTSIVNLRNIMPRVRLEKIGVIHRSFSEQLVRINQDYCRKEHTELVPYLISDKGDIESELKKGLDILEKKENIDALWVLNDSILVNAQLLRSAWIPFARKFKKPVIAGIEVLVGPKLNFGTFGVVPDHLELGAQAAQMIYDIMDNDWQVGKKGVEQPRSVYKILNLEQAENLFRVGKEQLNFVDKLLK